MLSSKSLLCAEYSPDDSYIQEEFSKIQDNSILLALNYDFKPSHIINYISAKRNGYINPILKDFTADELKATEEITNYWMFPISWTKAIQEEIACKEKDFNGPILAPIAKSNMERICKIFSNVTEVKDDDDPFELIKMFETITPSKNDHICEYDCYCEHIVNSIYDDINITPNAAKYGEIECLKYAHEIGFNWNEDTCSNAAAYGNLECLQYAHENGCPWNENTTASAAESGYIECLKYAHENGCPWGYFTCSWAALRGKLDCLKYAHENGCPWDKKTCSNAAFNGHLDCLKYAQENGCPQS